MSTVDIDKLRAEILIEFKQVLKLAPADYTENCTNVVMSLIEARYLPHLKAELLAKIDGLEVDIDETTAHIERAGGTETDITNMEIEADDRHETLNEFRKIVEEL